MEKRENKPNFSTALHHSNNEQVNQNIKSEPLDENDIEYELPTSQHFQMNEIIKSEPVENVFIKQEIFDEPVDTSSVKIELPDNNINEFKQINIITELHDEIDPLAQVETIYVNAKDKVKKHKCETCGKLFNRSQNLKVHIASVHEGVKNRCEICGKTFSTSGYMKIHISSVHE